MTVEARRRPRWKARRAASRSAVASPEGPVLRAARSHGGFPVCVAQRKVQPISGRLRLGSRRPSAGAPASDPIGIVERSLVRPVPPQCCARRGRVDRLTEHQCQAARGAALRSLATTFVARLAELTGLTTRDADGRPVEREGPGLSPLCLTPFSRAAGETGRVTNCPYHIHGIPFRILGMPPIASSSYART